MRSQCRATNADGQPCQAQPVRDSGYCYWHDPATAAAREAGRQRGGKGRSNTARAKREFLAAGTLTSEEILAYLGFTLRRLHAGKVESGVANALANVARAWRDVHAHTELEQRVAAAEQRVGQGNYES